MFAEALERAAALQQAGDVAAAERCYKEILVADPRQFDALHSLGVLEAQRGRYEEALRLVVQALKIEPQSISAKISYGNVLKSLNRHLQALAICNEILEVEPDSALALYNRGNVLLELDRFDEALNDYDKVVTLMPDNAPALYNRGCVLQKLERPAEALACYDRVLALVPDNFETIHNRGTALQALKRNEEALASFDLALMIAPDDAEVLNNRGVTLHELKRWDDALLSYDRALKIRPDYAEALSNLGNTLFDVNQIDAALESYERALKIKPDYVDALINRGHALRELKRAAGALASYEQALKLDPESEFLFGAWLIAKMQICDWRGVEDQIAQLEQKIQSNKKVSPPFSLLALSSSAAVQKKAAEIWVESKYSTITSVPKHPGHPQHDKLRIGYFSADFRNHPVALLTAQLFETHDKSRFELTAFSLGPAIDDEIRRRIEAAFDNFVDVRNKSDQEVAMLARDLEIDIAIDLGGFTEGARPAIFAMRAAPLQVSYLGYLGTMGADYIDYLIADETIIPQPHRSDYTENIVYLPTYQANDSERRIADIRFNRKELGLPLAGFVFCCFNNNFKITPAIFDVWMRILKQVEGSVLFLFAENETAKNNLGNEAESRGVGRDRLIFGEHLPVPEYRARYRIADLFLDTLPYNAGTTASDALWAGLPVVTCAGTTFAGRVAASCLNAIGLPELITTSLAEYEALAVKLASQPAVLLKIKAKLEANRSTHPLFDTKRFCSRLEAAYAAMWERSQRGEAPANFGVPNIH